MKKLLLATAFAAATLAVAPAFAQPTGFLGFSDSQTTVKAAGVKDDANTITVDGALSIPLDQGYYVTFGGDIQDGDGQTSGSLAVHSGKRFDAGLAGGFLGYSKADNMTMVGVGLDGQFYPTDTSTVAGTLGYLTNDDPDVNAWVANVEGRYFVTDNFRFNVDAGYMDADYGSDVEGWTAGAGAEYQFGATPLSVFGGYSHGDSSDLDAKADTWTLGFRVNFSGSLKDRDRSGAALGGIDSLTGGLPF